MTQLLERQLDRIFGSTLFQVGVFGGLGFLVYTFWIRSPRRDSRPLDEKAVLPLPVEELMPGVNWEVLREATNRASTADMIRWSMRVLKVRSNGEV